MTLQQTARPPNSPPEVEGRQIQIAEFSSLTNTTPRARTLSWPELVEKLSHHVELGNKNDGRLWSPAVYRHGGKRGKAGVELITAFVADVDHQDVPPESLADYEYVKVSSYSHSDDDPHFRYVLPVTRDIRAEEHSRVWLQVKTHVLPEMDSQCKDASRGFFEPAVPPGGHGVVEHHAGAWLDPDALPPIVEAPKAATRERARTDEPADTLTAWAQRFAAQRLEQLAAATKGQRNGAANRTAYTLAGLAAAGLLNANDLIEDLYSACERNGLVADKGERATRATIRSGLEDGGSKPWSPEDQPDDWQPPRAESRQVRRAAERRTIKDVVKIFERWLHLRDPGAVYVTLATIAANRTEGDPLWTMLVGGPGWGKTEILRSTSNLTDVHPAATLTEGALLSGTSKKEKAAAAKGGLLRQIGAYGILICKDFTSILSMHRDPRGQLLAALREIYDGEWTRHVGVDGGRTLSWSGKLGLIAACTTAIDTHHAVMAVMGERFVLYRLGEVDAAAQGRQALANTGHERELRDELAEAVQDLFATLDIQADRPLPALEPAETERLIALAALAARCRSAVERDGYSHEIELIADPEAPARLAQALRRLYGGLLLIGLSRAEAWPYVTKTALDSMPKLRRGVFDALAALSGDNEADTATLAAAMGYPTITARRSLEDLGAHGVVQRSGSQGRADRWSLTPWAREMLNAADLQPHTEKSVTPYNAHSARNGSTHTPPTDAVRTLTDFSVGGSGCRACGRPLDVIAEVAGFGLHLDCADRP